MNAGQALSLPARSLGTAGRLAFSAPGDPVAYRSTHDGGKLIVASTLPSAVAATIIDRRVTAHLGRAGGCAGFSTGLSRKNPVAKRLAG